MDYLLMGANWNESAGTTILFAGYFLSVEYIKKREERRKAQARK